MTSPSDPSHAESELRARAFLVVLCLGWGITWATMRIALTDIPPFSMRVASLALGAITMAILALLQGRRLQWPNRRAWAHLAVASFFNIIAFSIFTPFAQLSAATSRVAIVVYTMPIWASLLAMPVLGERLDGMRVLALALCAGGLAILIYPLAIIGTPVGLLLALGAAVSWAAGTVYLKWARIDGDPVSVTLWQLVIGLVAIAAVLPMVEGSLHLRAGLGPLLALIFSGVVGTGISYFLWFDIVRRLPASTAALGVLSSPVVGVVASVLMLGERPTMTDILGFALMLAASSVVLLRPHQDPREAVAQGRPNAT
jgi:drug/metabolite transporter (DMT)-like permease